MYPVMLDVENRPCLVVGGPEGTGLAWVLMITSAKNSEWPGDIEIKNLAEAGLKSASIIRTAKIATVEAELLKPIGILDEATSALVTTKMNEHISSS